MKKNTVAKRMIAGALALSLAFSGAVFVGALDGSEVSQAALAAPKVLDEGGIEVYVSEDDDALMRFYWNKVEGADGYEYSYCTDYDPESNANEFVTEETESLFAVIDIKDGHGSIGLKVAAKKGNTKSAYSDVAWWNGDLIDANVLMERSANTYKIYEKKARALAKKDKKKGYAKLTWGVWDINGDGYEEMLYVRHGARDEVLVFSYDKKTKKPVLVKTADGKKSIGGVKSILANKKTIIFDTGSSAGELATVTYKLTSTGKLKATERVKANYYDNVFTRNGKEITEKAYDKYQKKIAKYTQVDFSAKL
ncbi:MAG: hypothetical protein K6B14_02370 [Lachnospiraceae bacterium]|nr:hypothetical protein [Lachnospiraceae bacterium]